MMFQIKGLEGFARSNGYTTTTEMIQRFGSFPHPENQSAMGL
ncbi:MAG: hypothetical protein QE271_04940 [Bacteriovoracaceae bacterium]|nr:hypothetical protein [Bacteriovoracaceae bacterium]